MGQRTLLSLCFVCALPITGCLPHTTDSSAIDRLREINTQSAVKTMAERRAQVSAYALPATYKAQIDTHFEDSLKDPESRRIAYTGTPYGGLVCGTINARNSYGGYAGKRPFIAVFYDTGRLQVKSYSTEDMIAFERFKLAEYAIPDSLLGDYAFLRDCGY